MNALSEGVGQMVASRFRRRVMDAAVMMFVIAAVMHFGHRAMVGESGWDTRLKVEREIRELKAERARLEAEKDRLANLTKRLSPEYLDLDLLDERAREMLGYVREDEIVIR